MMMMYVCMYVYLEGRGEFYGVGGVGADAMADGGESYGHGFLTHSDVAHPLQIRNRVKMRRQVDREPSRNIGAALSPLLLSLPVRAAHNTHPCACTYHTSIII